MVAHVRGTAQQIKDLPAALKGGDKVLSELAKLCAAPVPVTVVGARKASTFSSLSAGRNDGVYLQCRVLGPLKAMDKPPQ